MGYKLVTGSHSWSPQSFHCSQRPAVRGSTCGKYISNCEQPPWSNSRCHQQNFLSGILCAKSLGSRGRCIVLAFSDHGNSICSHLLCAFFLCHFPAQPSGHMDFPFRVQMRRYQWTALFWALILYRVERWNRRREITSAYSMRAQCRYLHRNLTTCSAQWPPLLTLTDGWENQGSEKLD